MATMSSKEATSIHDVQQLTKLEAGATIYPSDDALLSLLQQRFRSDLPYTRLGSSTLVVVNPLKKLGNLSDASARDYVESEYTDTSGEEGPRGPKQPHLYELAARVYLLMRRRKESQAVIFRSVRRLLCSFGVERASPQRPKLTCPLTPFSSPLPSPLPSSHLSLNPPFLMYTLTTI
jgi:hypothetical protein